MIIHNINAIYKTEYKVLNVSNLNTFTNSSNISTIPSSILYNRTHRSANGKIMNVLLMMRMRRMRSNNMIIRFKKVYCMLSL